VSWWRPTFWRFYWISLRRSPRDKRARVLALQITVFLLFVLIYVLFWLLPLRSPGGIYLFGFYIVIFGSALITRLLISRSNRNANEVLSFSLTGSHRRTPEGTTYVSEAVRHYLAERTLILGSLMARAASEIYIQGLSLDAGEDVISRQIQNAFLRQAGLWEKLEPVERTLVIAADGQWTTEQRNQVATWSEQLRLLRWVLGLDAELVPLAHSPKVDFTLSRGLLRQRLVTVQSRRMLKPWDVRVERDIALTYTARIIAELNSRGVLTTDGDVGNWAGELRDIFLGESNDLLVGVRTVGELSNDALRLLCVSASARERYAAYLVDQLSADHPSSFAAWSESRQE
jgi:hypothetical protein